MPYDAKTLDALHRSCAKWNAIVAGTGTDQGPDNCPLCRLFLDRQRKTCAGCPVRDKTGQDLCFGTPYRDYDDARQLWYADDIGDEERDRRQADAARREADFLQSLLTDAEGPSTHDRYLRTDGERAETSQVAHTPSP